MMGLGPEGWLMLLAIGLYVYDSALLLAPDELILRQDLRGRWCPQFGALRWRLNGREPYIPPLLIPSLGLVRLRWQPQDVLRIPPPQPDEHPPQAGVAAQAQWPCAPSPFDQSLVTALWVVIFVGLPLALWWRPMALRTIVTLVFIYGLCALCAWRLFRGGVPALRKHALELVACPPFAVNLVHKLSLAQNARVSLAHIHATLRETEREAMRLQLRARLQDMLDTEPDGGSRIALLQEAIQHLDGALNPEHVDAT